MVPWRAAQPLMQLWALATVSAIASASESCVGQNCPEHGSASESNDVNLMLQIKGSTLLVEEPVLDSDEPMEDQKLKEDAEEEGPKKEDAREEKDDEEDAEEKDDDEVEAFDVAADDSMYHETLVHPALALVHRPSSVLIVGGGEGATLREVIKDERVSNVVMVDIDQRFVQFAKEHLQEMHQGSFSSSKATVLFQDGAQFLQESKGQAYDVIIVDGTDSDRNATHPLFELSFVSNAYKSLRDGGAYSQYASAAAVALAPRMKKAGFRSVTTLGIPTLSLGGGGALIVVGQKASMNTTDAILKLPHAVDTLQETRDLKFLNVATLKTAMVVGSDRSSSQRAHSSKPSYYHPDREHRRRHIGRIPVCTYKGIVPHCYFVEH